MRNNENLRKWNREYYQKRKNELEYKKRRRESAVRHYASHKKEFAERGKKYRLSHKDQYNKYRREYRYNNPIGIYSVIKDGLNNKGTRRSLLLKISRDDFVKWYISENKVCHYCKRTFSQSQGDPLNRKVHRLTIDRIDNSKGYEKGNLTLACLRCNAVKNNYFTESEMLKIGKIIHDKND